MGLTGISRGVWGKPRNLPWEGYGYFLVQHFYKSAFSLRSKSAFFALLNYLFLIYTRKLHVTPQSRTCCSIWNALQVIFVMFTIGTMISMMWFTIILKTSLESMKKRVTSCKSAVPSANLPNVAKMFPSFSQFLQP